MKISAEEQHSDALLDAAAVREHWKNWPRGVEKTIDQRTAENIARVNLRNAERELKESEDVAG